MILKKLGIDRNEIKPAPKGLIEKAMAEMIKEAEKRYGVPKEIYIDK